MILALVYRKKCLPIVYSPKMTHVLDDIEFYGYTYRLGAKEDFDVKRFESFLRDNEYYVINSEYLELAKKQFIYLDKILC